MNRRPAEPRLSLPTVMLRLVQSVMRSAVETLPLGLLSFGLAVVIWVTVTREENPSVRRLLSAEVAVEQVNVPRTLVVTNLTPARVSVVVSGPSSLVNDVRPEDVLARVDLARVEEELGGLREATVERPIRAEVRRRGVRADPSPERATITVERQERRTVPVCVQRVDVPPPGFAVEEPITVEPAEAVLLGPRRNVEAVECAAAVLRLTGLTVNVNAPVQLEPRDASGRVIGGVTVQPQTATVNARVRQSLYPRQVVIDARLTGRPAAGYSVAGVRLDPATATVVGPLDVVNALPSIATEPIDIEGARTDVVRSVSLQVPNGVSSGERRAVVTVTIQAVRAPGSVGAVPRVVNLGPGLTAALTTPTVAVLISGPMSEVLAVRPADVSVTVDASGLTPGVHRLEPRVVLPAGLSLDGVVPDRVEVTIGTTR